MDVGDAGSPDDGVAPLVIDAKEAVGVFLPSSRQVELNCLLLSFSRSWPRDPQDYGTQQHQA